MPFFFLVIHRSLNKEWNWECLISVLTLLTNPTNMSCFLSAQLWTLILYANGRTLYTTQCRKTTKDLSPLERGFHHPTKERAIIN